jgi:hypothetical protein
MVKNHDLYVLLAVGVVAAVAIVIMLASVPLPTGEGSLVGQAFLTITKTGCKGTQQNLYIQAQKRCSTMGGTWKGNSKTCKIDCQIKKK